MTSVIIVVVSLLLTLTDFNPIVHFYTPWKCQKTFGFLTISGGIEMKHWTKIGLNTFCSIFCSTSFIFNSNFGQLFQCKS